MSRVAKLSRKRRYAIARGVSPWKRQELSPQPRSGDTRGESRCRRFAANGLVPWLGSRPGYCMSPLRGWSLGKRGLFSPELLPVFLLAAPAARGRQPQITAALGQDEIYEGQSVVYRVIVENVENPQTPELRGMDDFDVAFLGQQSLDSQQITIINGVMQRGRPPRPGIPLSPDAQEVGRVHDPRAGNQGRRQDPPRRDAAPGRPAPQCPGPGGGRADGRSPGGLSHAAVHGDPLGLRQGTAGAAVRPRSPFGPEAAARAADSLAHGPGPAGRTVVQGRLADMGQGIHRPGGRGLRHQRPRAADGLFLLRREQRHRLPPEAASR